MPSLNEWLFVIGLACYWPTFRNSFFGLVFSEGGEGLGHLDVEYLLFLGFVALWCGACLARPRLVEAFLAARRFAVCGLCVLASVGMSLVYCVDAFDLPWAASFAGVAFSSAGFVVLTFAWSNEVVRARSRNLFFDIALSFLLSFVLSLTSLLPGPFSLALPFFSWAISGLAYAAYRAPRIGSKAASASAACGRDGLAARIGSARVALDGIVVLLIAFLVIGAFVRGFLYLGTIAYSPEQTTLSRRVVSFALSFLVAVVAYRADSGKPPLFWLWTLVSLVFFSGLFLIAALYPLMPDLAGGVAITGRTFVSFFLWVALALTVRERGGHLLVPVVGILFIMVECASGFCSYFLAPEIARAIGLPMSAYLPFFALLIAFILISSTIVFLALLANRRLAEPTDAPRLTRERACAALGEERGLTAREVEVMERFSQGNSLRKVAETMFISTSTAQSHVKSVYRKLGIHSKQELIDLVGDRMGKRM
ncbi:helix-turn-helix transcriptional regulator [Gordonibacter sp. An230]|uniref:helix-turn-helix transcriptional regulator n=1 Tax=Gordonibacter sp. An230 TaxID=1965592 RepID=UPI00111EEB5C|nr:helix-turn-helix transcriptional regulator [Gordonibacter sp. An230]